MTATSAFSFNANNDDDDDEDGGFAPTASRTSPTGSKRSFGQLCGEESAPSELPLLRKTKQTKTVGGVDEDAGAGAAAAGAGAAASTTARKQVRALSAISYA
jgi:hypothetical protein